MSDQNVASADRRSAPRRRRPWLAALLGFLAPGAGQLYGGEPRAAVIWFAVFAVLNIVFQFGLPGLHPDVPVLGLFVALSLGALVLQTTAAVHAFIHTRRTAPAPLRRFQRAWLYALMVIAFPTLGVAAAPRWIKSYYVASSSNAPSLLVGDRFLIEVGYFRRHPPERGDMAVFRLATDNGTDYVKRIVGLPGDTVQMRDGVLYVNGEPVPRKSIDDYVSASEGATVVMHQYVETLPGGAAYRIVKVGDNGPLDNTPAYAVPPGSYFALGDNRDNSLDSRMQSQFGYVPAAKLTGRAYIVYWPLSRFGMKPN